MTWRLQAAKLGLTAPYPINTGQIVSNYTYLTPFGTEFA